MAKLYQERAQVGAFTSDILNAARLLLVVFEKKAQPEEASLL
ncbi:MAG: hypothetical protein WKG06_26820 [Segetibacter sp.]